MDIVIKKVPSPVSLVKFTGANQAPDGTLLSVASLIARVEMRFAECIRVPVLTSTGFLSELNLELSPKNLDNFETLDPIEYQLEETLQPAQEGIGEKPWSFLFQPGRHRRPFFPHPGVFEVHFRLIPIDENTDIIEFPFKCLVATDKPRTLEVNEVA